VVTVLASGSAAMAAMEKMEERAGQQQQVGQDPEDVRGVLGDHEEAGDPKEGEQDHARARSKP
jgi:hypothetical protein